LKTELPQLSDDRQSFELNGKQVPIGDVLNTGFVVGPDHTTLIVSLLAQWVKNQADNQM
jgi:hypothetical protein